DHLAGRRDPWIRGGGDDARRSGGVGTVGAAGPGARTHRSTGVGGDRDGARVVARETPYLPCRGTRPRMMGGMRQQGGSVANASTDRGTVAGRGLMEIEPIKSTRIYEEIVRQVKQLIADGKLKSGDRLPPERDLAEKFMVSRTSVREALRALQSR